jgi:hypothetical protein
VLTIFQLTVRSDRLPGVDDLPNIAPENQPIKIQLSSEDRLELLNLVIF